jgi:hypothetical protein
MARYLLNVVETYRVPTVNEALEMRDEMNAAAEYELQSFQYTTKFNKKTEEEYQIVKVKKVINSEKDPISGVRVKYEY